MADVIIENPILNSPYRRAGPAFPVRGRRDHQRDRRGRRSSSYFMPIARPKKKGKQLAFDTEWTQDRIEENKAVNRIRRTGQALAGRRSRRASRRPRASSCSTGPTPTASASCSSARSRPWRRSSTSPRSPGKSATPGSRTTPRRQRHHRTPAPPRRAEDGDRLGQDGRHGHAHRLAALNKLANPQDRRFSDTFLIVTPGITIRDRLRVLLPNDSENYYRLRDLVPADLIGQLGQAKIVITNFHAFQLRETIERQQADQGDPSAAAPTSSPKPPPRWSAASAASWAPRGTSSSSTTRPTTATAASPTTRPRCSPAKIATEAEKRNEEARVWISGLEAVQRQDRHQGHLRPVRHAVLPPRFGLPRGDALPLGRLRLLADRRHRVGNRQDSRGFPSPTTRCRATSRPTATSGRASARICPARDGKPKQLDGEPKLPAELQGALQSLYGNYEKYQRALGTRTPIARANGLDAARLHRRLQQHQRLQARLRLRRGLGEVDLPTARDVLVPGPAGRSSTTTKTARWSPRPHTILVDSEQLESGEGMSAEFKQIAAREIEEFKAEYRARFPGRDAESLTDEDLLREVMNTVGKPGKLGEHVRCVVSVSMLTEGWDANTVTHVLGVRAFGTQLLCEQVVGRALRRMSYAANDEGLFEPEYAEVYGVPFSFIPCSGTAANPKPGPTPTRVRAIPEAGSLRDHVAPPARLPLRAASRTAHRQVHRGLAPRSDQRPTSRPRPRMRPIVGESQHSIRSTTSRSGRLNEVAFLLAKLTLEKYFRRRERGRTRQSPQVR